MLNNYLKFCNSFGIWAYSTEPDQKLNFWIVALGECIPNNQNKLSACVCLIYWDYWWHTFNTQYSAVPLLYSQQYYESRKTGSFDIMGNLFMFWQWGGVAVSVTQFYSCFYVVKVCFTFVSSSSNFLIEMGQIFSALVRIRK